MLLSSDASCIRIDIGYDAWLNNNATAQHELQNITSQIQSAGKGLIIADESAEYYRSHPLHRTQFRAAWESRVKTLATVFHPAFYIVIKEPGWYVPNGFRLENKSTISEFNRLDTARGKSSKHSSLIFYEFQRLTTTYGAPIE
jgi:uncharacterized protein (DUF927 family)